MPSSLENHTATRGFVFAATGAGYTDVAIRGAHSLRTVHPDAQIDLFTDQPVAPDGIDRIHPIPNDGPRPKFSALLNSRFDRTVYLDADTLTIAPINDIFDVLDRFDVAAAHDEGPNCPSHRKMWRQDIPVTFPQLNTGVIGLRKSAATHRLMAECDRVFRSEDLTTDQPVFRELLYLSDLRLCTLPQAYNCMFAAHLEAHDHMQISPRVLHNPRLHNHLHGHGRQIFNPRQAVGPMIWRHIQTMRASDVTLGAKEWTPFLPMMDQGPLQRLRRYIYNSLRKHAR